VDETAAVQEAVTERRAGPEIAATPRRTPVERLEARLRRRAARLVRAATVAAGAPAETAPVVATVVAATAVDDGQAAMVSGKGAAVHLSRVAFTFTHVSDRVLI
jgi:hypothetical protein